MEDKLFNVTIEECRMLGECWEHSISAENVYEAMSKGIKKQFGPRAKRSTYDPKIIVEQCDFAENVLHPHKVTVTATATTEE